LGFTTGQKIGLVGAAIVVVGAFLPWVTWGVFSVAGTSGDGVITLIFGIIIGGLALGSSSNIKAAAVLILGFLVLLIGAYDASNVVSIAEAPFGIPVKVGTGLGATILGGLIVLVSGIVELAEKKPKNRSSKRY